MLRRLVAAGGRRAVDSQQRRRAASTGQLSKLNLNTLGLDTPVPGLPQLKCVRARAPSHPRLWLRLPVFLRSRMCPRLRANDRLSTEFVVARVRAVVHHCPAIAAHSTLPRRPAKDLPAPIVETTTLPSGVRVTSTDNYGQGMCLSAFIDTGTKCVRLACLLRARLLARRAVCSVGVQPAKCALWTCRVCVGRGGVSGGRGGGWGLKLLVPRTREANELVWLVSSSCAATGTRRMCAGCAASWRRWRSPARSGARRPTAPPSSSASARRASPRQTASRWVPGVHSSINYFIPAQT
jgi:hypothetical protein